MYKRQIYNGEITVTGNRSSWKDDISQREEIPFTHNYTICGDTIYAEWIHDNNYNHPESSIGFQIGGECYLANKENPNDHIILRTNEPGINKFEKSDWKKYRKKNFTHKALDTSVSKYKMTYKAKIDEATEYNQQFEQKGYFPHFFNILGRFDKLVRTEPQREWTYNFKYKELTDNSCKDLIPSISLDSTETLDFSEHLTSVDIAERKNIALFDYTTINDEHHTSQYLISRAIENKEFTYIDIWATSCKPCIEEFAHLQNIYDQFSGKALNIVSLSVDFDRELPIWKKMVFENNFPWENYHLSNSMDSALLTELGVYTLPRYILLDPNGKIINPNAPRPSNVALVEYLEQTLSSWQNKE